MPQLNVIFRELQGSECLLGYRNMWNRLKRSIIYLYQGEFYILLREHFNNITEMCDDAFS